MKETYTLDELNRRVELELFVQKLFFIPICFASGFVGAFIVLVLSLLGVL